MGGMFSKPKPDQSLINEQRKQAQEAEKRETKEKEAQEDLRRRQRSGRRSLLGTDGDELGVM